MFDLSLDFGALAGLTGPFACRRFAQTDNPGSRLYFALPGLWFVLQQGSGSPGSGCILLMHGF
jgi:hypothetical protein